MVSSLCLKNVRQFCMTIISCIQGSGFSVKLTVYVQDPCCPNLQTRRHSLQYIPFNQITISHVTNCWSPRHSTSTVHAQSQWHLKARIYKLISEKKHGRTQTSSQHINPNYAAPNSVKISEPPDSAQFAQFVIALAVNLRWSLRTRPISKLETYEPNCNFLRRIPVEEFVNSLSTAMTGRKGQGRRERWEGHVANETMGRNVREAGRTAEMRKDLRSFAGVEFQGSGYDQA